MPLRPFKFRLERVGIEYQFFCSIHEYSYLERHPVYRFR